MRFDQRARRPKWQGVFPFVTRRQRRERAFKLLIATLTISTLSFLLFGTWKGRYATLRGLRQTQALARSLVGIPVDPLANRQAIAAERELGIRIARQRYQDRLAQLTPEYLQFLEAAAMGPDSALIAWGGGGSVFALSSAVFEPDDSGRSYRLRPNVKSFWVSGLSFAEVAAMFLVPDRPEVREALARMKLKPARGSDQSTSSWGFRGPEPDPEAPLRVLVLGDSMMQGVLVLDDQTAPAYLHERLDEALGVSVSVLNAGVLGYGLEQIYHTLLDLGERFAPHVVVISLCHNDFADLSRPDGPDHWGFWLEKIAQHCRTNEWVHLFVPLPLEESLLGRRNVGTYPGAISRELAQGGTRYLDPTEDFTDLELHLRFEAAERNDPLHYSPLFNRDRGDLHFSPIGNATWGRTVGRRLTQLLEYQSTLGNRIIQRTGQTQ